MIFVFTSHLSLHHWKYSLVHNEYYYSPKRSDQTTRKHIEGEMHSHINPAPANQQRPRKKQQPVIPFFHRRKSMLQPRQQPKKSGECKTVGCVTGNKTISATATERGYDLFGNIGIVTGTQAANIILEEICRLIGEKNHGCHGYKNHEHLFSETFPQ